MYKFVINLLMFWEFIEIIKFVFFYVFNFKKNKLLKIIIIKKYVYC